MMTPFQTRCEPRRRPWRSVAMAGLCVTTLLAGNAQATDISRPLLAAARQDAGDYRTDGDSSVPWLERLQMRLGRDNSDTHKQTYAARLRLKTPSQIQAERDILELRSGRGRLSHLDVLSESLADRYRLLVELDRQQREVDLLQREQRLSQRGVTAMRRLAGSDDFRPDRLQAEELRLQATSDRLALARHRLRQTKTRAAALAGLQQLPGDGIGKPTLIPVDELSQLIAASGPNNTGPDTGDAGNNPALRLALLETDIARRQLRREQGRSGFGLRFMQLSYEREDRNDDVYQLTVGIDLPTGRRSFASADRHQRFNEAEYRMHRIQRQQAGKRRAAAAEFELLMSEYRAIGRQLQGLDRRLRRQGSGTPIGLKLELERSRLSSARRQAELRNDLYQRAIDSLDLQGSLSVEPLKNWLAPGQPLL